VALLDGCRHSARNSRQDMAAVKQWHPATIFSDKGYVRASQEKSYVERDQILIELISSRPASQLAGTAIDLGRDRDCGSRYSSPGRARIRSSPARLGQARQEQERRWASAHRRRQGFFANDDGVEIWAKPLEDGAKAVGIFNRGETPGRVTARWSDLGLSSNQLVRDLWRQTNLGAFDSQFSTDVAATGWFCCASGRRNKASALRAKKSGVILNIRSIVGRIDSSPLYFVQQGIA
jgi:Alpha galactosidase C-terminal beta sandwich domain